MRDWLTVKADDLRLLVALRAALGIHDGSHHLDCIVRAFGIFLHGFDIASEQDVLTAVDHFVVEGDCLFEATGRNTDDGLKLGQCVGLFNEATLEFLGVIVGELRMQLAHVIDFLVQNGIDFRGEGGCDDVAVEIAFSMVGFIGSFIKRVPSFPTMSVPLAARPRCVPKYCVPFSSAEINVGIDQVAHMPEVCATSLRHADTVAGVVEGASHRDETGLAGVVLQHLFITFKAAAGQDNTIFCADFNGLSIDFSFDSMNNFWSRGLE